MVLKFDNNQNDVYLLEATATFGVALNKWSQLREHIGYKKFWAKCVYRHIEFNRSNEMFDKLEIFLRETEGLQYGLEANKLVRKETIKKTNVDREMIDEDRTFFCSELIAKGYKELGILQDDKTASCMFYPHHFCMKG